MRLMLLALGSVVLLGAACSDDEGGSDASDNAESQESVVLVTYDSFALPESAAAAFKEQTGAEIEVVAAGDSGSMLAGALLSAGSPDGDVIFGIDNTTATEVLGEELLEEYSPSGIDAVDPQFRLDGELGDLLTPIDTGDVCLNVDTAWFDSAGIEPPSTFQDLTAAEYAELLVVENPVNSSPGMAFMLGTIDAFGEDSWLEQWEAMKTGGVKVAPSWDDAYYNDYTVNGGDRPVVVSYASSPPAEVIFSEGERSEPASAVALDTCVAQVEYAGLLSGAQNPELGRALLDFMLSDEWQSALPEANFVYPVTDADLPESFLKWAPRPEDPVILDAYEVGENRDTWIEQWRSVME